MRESLFRGKHGDEWVEGYYLKLGNMAFIIIDSDMASDMAGEYVKMKEVISETVSEYTGLMDNNGKRIFEGDIVTFESRGRHVGDVQFDWGVFGVEWTECKRDKSIMEPLGNKHNLRTFADGFNEAVEVIGNVYDNPELLEVKE